MSSAHTYCTNGRFSNTQRNYYALSRKRKCIVWRCRFFATEKSTRDRYLSLTLCSIEHEMVGARGFEPPTTWPPAKYATRLRYAPKTAIVSTAKNAAIVLLEQFDAKTYGGGGRNRTGVHGFAGRCMTTLPLRHITSTALHIINAG